MDCVVFGRVAGKAAAKYMLGADMKDVDLREVTGGGLTGAVESSKLAGGSYEDKMNSAAVPAAALLHQLQAVVVEVASAWLMWPSTTARLTAGLW